MPDTEIPQELIDSQRAFDTAHATLMADTNSVSDARRQKLRREERDAALALQAVRARVEGGRWATVAGQKELWAAARGPAA